MGLLILVLTASCGGASHAKIEGGDTLTHSARLLTLVDHGTYSVADVTDPWDTTRLMSRYVLVPRDAKLPDNLPEGVVVRTPLQRSLVYSGVHGGAIDELGAVDAIAGVTEGQYFNNQQIVQRLSAGKIVDVGNAQSPTVEKIVNLQPDAILLSPYQNAGDGVVGELGVPIIRMADYMEATPLARAEWVKFLGLLYGNPEGSDAIFAKTQRRYGELREMALRRTERPTIVTEQVIDGVWYVPGGASYHAALMRDAGGTYLWGDDRSSGSLQLDFAKVFDRAHDADVWLMRSYQEMTLDALKASYPLNAQMEAFKRGDVYNANTSAVTLFDDFPFHPDTILRDYIIILHPSLSLGQPTYFKRVK